MVDMLAVILSALLSGKNEAPLPSTSPPEFKIISKPDEFEQLKPVYETCFKQVTRIVIVDGKEKKVVETIPYTVCRMVRESILGQEVQFYTAQGEKLSHAKVRQILNGKPTPVLFLPPGQIKVDPLFLRILKGNALIAVRTKPDAFSKMAENLFEPFLKYFFSLRGQGSLMDRP